MDDAVTRARSVLAEGGRLTAADAVALYESTDLVGIGELALAAKRRASGDEVFYALNVNVNPTNLCTLRCPICAFSRSEGEPGAYFREIDEIAGSLDALLTDRIREVHVVGGVSPRVDFAYTTELLRRIKALRPKVFVQALTAVEIDAFACAEGLTLEATLSALREAGLDAIPGGGAEIFADRVRRQVAPDKIPADRWLEVMATAHRLGIPTNATMLYGHVETIAERVDHLQRLRDLQDSSLSALAGSCGVPGMRPPQGGFRSFVPLAFHAGNTRFPDLPPTTGFDDLKTYAVARLFLDNVPHVKGLWMYLGLELAQVALNFGVDDLGGVSLDERIVHAAGAKTPAGADERAIRRTIAAAGFAPVACDSAYADRYPAPGGDAA